MNPALEAQWQSGARQLGIDSPEFFRPKIERLHDLLTAANRTTNLTRITEPGEFLIRHVLDSLSLLPFLPEGANLADVGSGPGFPAVPLAVVRPDLGITAIEATGKKCAFIESVRDELELANLRVLHRRAEEAGRDPELRESFGRVTGRALSALPVLLELTAPLLKPGGQLLAMKGANFQPELDAAAHAADELGLVYLGVDTPPVPALAQSRILRFEKTARTPEKYPRRSGIPAKNPL